jgi:aminoglycoside phosphotransferase (APT) family kinase protein
VVQSTHFLVIGEQEVVKTYIDWARGEPEREWRALTLLHEFAPGLSPKPVRRGTAEGRPFVVMSRLPGEPLGEQPLTPAQVAGLGEAMSRLYRSVPDEALAGVPARNWGADQMVARVRDWSAEPWGAISRPVERALSVGSTWLAGPEASAVVEPPGERVFTLGDGNLGNVLWDGTRCYLVDFEDAGASDIAYEVADLVEHISVWLDGMVTAGALAPCFTLTASERGRLLLCRRLFAIFWLLMLLPDNPAHHRNPQGTLERQAHRVVELLG